MGSEAKTEPNFFILFSRKKKTKFSKNQALDSHIFQTLDPDPHEMDADPKPNKTMRIKDNFGTCRSVEVADPAAATPVLVVIPAGIDPLLEQRVVALRPQPLHPL